MNKIVTIISLFCIFSCIYIEAPEVKNINPGYNEILKGEKIEILFSKVIDEESIDNSVFLYSNNTEIPFSYKLEKKKLILTIEENTEINQNTRYKILISSDIKSSDGINLPEDYISYFYGESNYYSFQVIESSPDFSQSESPLDIFRITFNQEPDETSFEGNISIEPQIDYYLVREQNTVEIHPVSTWENNVLYKITLSKKIKSTENETLINETVLYHKNTSNNVQPILTNYLFTQGNPIILYPQNNSQHSGIGCTTSIELNFSNEMDYESLKNAISFQPAIPFQLIKDNSRIFRIKPNNPFEYNRAYSLLVKNTAEDIYSNILLKEYKISFKTNSSIDAPLQIDQIITSTNCILDTDLINTIPFEQVTNLIITFSRETAPETIPENIFINMICGDISNLSGAIKKFNWIDQRTLSIEITSLHYHNTYCISFTGGENGIKDSYGKTISETQKYYFQMEQQ